jgi:hypothetical protein
MKRRWNISVWLGFLLVLAAPVTYVALFIRFPATRDFPWATLLVFFVGLALIARGLVRAYREPALYRGKVAAPILMTLGVAVLALFAFGIFIEARQLPPSKGAPQVGQKAPDFTLPDEHGNPVTLSKLLDSGAQDASGAGGGAGATEQINGALLIFYRGYW